MHGRRPSHRRRCRPGTRCADVADAAVVPRRRRRRRRRRHASVAPNARRLRLHLRSHHVPGRASSAVDCHRAWACAPFDRQCGDQVVEGSQGCCCRRRRRRRRHRAACASPSHAGAAPPLRASSLHGSPSHARRGRAAPLLPSPALRDARAALPPVAPLACLPPLVGRVSVPLAAAACAMDAALSPSSWRQSQCYDCSYRQLHRRRQTH